ncbi:MAG: GlsB/YeaQ/YmgE family stress response membrane protein [Anaerolineae bacterium]|nr:GlsB/YeaQ/YmgE family stress response membrane protein [Anaerolineae bacterium]MDW8171286.1 GlsB/YeaQ/YmgE family stress response membrane protein [Anaerolineae bacterium]
MFDFIGAVIASPFICLGWLIVGFIAGALARRIMKRHNQPFFMDIILGIAGAVVGGFLINLFLPDTVLPDRGLPLLIANLFVATGGAAFLIWLGQLIRGR